MPIRADDPVFTTAQRMGLPDEFVRLTWWAFKRRHAGGEKRYRDWRAVFRRAVEEGWLRLWFAPGGGRYALTTAGLQAQRLYDAEQDEAQEQAA